MLMETNALEHILLDSADPRTTPCVDISHEKANK